MKDILVKGTVRLGSNLATGIVRGIGLCIGHYIGMNIIKAVKSNKETEKEGTNGGA